MASAPPTTSKPSSKWGLNSFLAGVESRLDTILADEDTPSGNPKKEDGGLHDLSKKKEATPVPGGLRAKDGISRTPSASRAQERLNERLAKAVANRNLNKTGDISMTTSGLPSRTASPANGTSSQRSSSEVKIGEAKSENDSLMQEPGTKSNSTQVDDVVDRHLQPPQEPTVQLAASSVSELDSTRHSLDSHRSISTRQSVDFARAIPTVTDSLKLNGMDAGVESKTHVQYEETMDQMRSDYESSELRRQEETHLYLERIDALQAKLQYLTKEAAGIAKSALSEAKPGSVDQKLASKDERIALLMEEGHKLSQTELKHINIIKKLRTKSSENDKHLGDTQKKVEKHEKSLLDAQERAKRAELAERRALDKSKVLPKVEKELESLKADRDAKASVIQDLQRQLSTATAMSLEAESRAEAEALDAERKLTADLSDELSDLRMEKDSIEKEFQMELRELREKAERERERARIAEIERQGEQNILESRLESFRARVEEASAGTSGDVQAKLLRQIETLQNQYAIASENWQGIEGSLLSRVAAVEKEKDDVSKREVDVRRKARDTNIRTRRIEEELERANAKLEDMDHEVLERKTDLTGLHEKLLRSEAEVTQARKDLSDQRELWEMRQARRLEEETKARPREESVRSPDTLYQQFHTESPVALNHRRKNSSAERNGKHTRRLQGLAITGTNHAALERPLSRHSSSQPLHYPSDFRSTSRQESITSIPQFSINNSVRGTPSPNTADTQDFDFMEGVRTPATPERTINDLISVSTVGAGPSVQLVERMSAAVRRLESEKADAKDELGRLSAQRDEAREQVVGLMREAEEKRKADERVRGLEEEVRAMRERYETTLEMLGEKSERVEELKADVQDVKEMYRDLVERTMQ